MNTEGWKRFKMDELFTSFERGKVHSQYSLPDGNDYFYVGAKKDRCGVMRHCGYDEDLISRGNCIVFICNGEGSVGYCNYMDRDFMASGDLILAYGDFINPYTALFIVTLLDRERPKYSFGRKYGKYVAKTTIPLPTQKDGETPDWDWIEKHTKENTLPLLPNNAKNVWLKQYETDSINDNNIQYNTNEWVCFKLMDLFEVKLTKGDIKADRIDGGTVPLVSSGESNNGVVKYISEDGDGIAETFPGNTITLDMFCHAYYQPKEYYAVGHGRVNILIPKFLLNKYIGSFLTTIIDKEMYRFSYGRAVYSNVAERIKIKLPVIPGTNNPDWQFMEDYIKSLPYSKNI